MTNITIYPATCPATFSYNKYVRTQKAKEVSLQVHKQPQGDRDTEMKKCYTAEWAYEKISRKAMAVAGGKEWDILSENELRAFVDKVVKSKTFDKIKTGPLSRIVVTMMQNRSGGLAGKASYGRIWIKPSHATKYLALHELVHAAGYNNHGVGFRVALLKLVSRFLGPAEAKTLKDCFKAKKLKTNMPTVKIKSYDEWLVGYERLKKAKKPLDI